MDSPDDDPRTTLGRRLFRPSESRWFKLVYVLAAGALLLITSWNAIVRVVVTVTLVLWTLRIQLASVARLVREMRDDPWGRFAWAQRVVLGGMLIVMFVVAFLPVVLFWPELLSTLFPTVLSALAIIGYTPALVLMAIIGLGLLILLALAIVNIPIQVIRAIYRERPRRRYRYPTL